MSHYHRIRAQLCWGLFTVLAAVSVWGSVPSPEKLLPDDTLILVTAPDFGKLRLVWQKLPQNQLWNDPAMKPFREDFTTKWRDQFIKPLERELDIKVDDYTSVLQGQLTFALIQNAGDGDSQEAGMVLLLDSKDKSGQLKKNLAGLRKKWVDSGKADQRYPRHFAQIFPEIPGHSRTGRRQRSETGNQNPRVSHWTGRFFTRAEQYDQSRRKSGITL
jgi:hypothetical protein